MPRRRTSAVAIGLDATGTRTESDAMGDVEVPADRYWGAQTQRSLLHFAIGGDRMPPEIHHAYGLVKRAAAEVNREQGRLGEREAAAIVQAADEVAAGLLDREFPLYVWQTGSGTQTNMNVNEVIANRAIQLLGGEVGSRTPVHPNDHVNLAQSSNDTFPTAMHVATALALTGRLLPAVVALRDAVADVGRRYAHVVKIGRTHLQDAVPLTVEQEWSAYAAQLDGARAEVEAALPGVLRLAIGGTAVGTGLNAPRGFDRAVARRLADRTGLPFRPAANKFAALSSLDGMVRVSSSLRGLATVAMKLADDVRWLGSGPRAGLGELRLPENEPGSSIMPGKVNPTQSEALLMVCVQVMALDVAVGAAGGMGNLQLNTFRPLAAENVLRCIRILGDALDHFRRFCVEGIEVDEQRVAEHVERSLMLVTALSPHIGYDAAAEIAHRAHHEGTTLREAAVASGHVTGEQFDRLVVPRRMTRPG